VIAIRAGHRRAAALLAAALPLAFAAPAAAGPFDRTVEIDVSNQTGQQLVPSSSMAPWGSTFTSAPGPIPIGASGSAIAESSCGLACTASAQVAWATPDSSQGVAVYAQNPPYQPSEASCSASQAWRCNVDYNSSGRQLVAQVTVYPAGAVAPAAQVVLGGPRLHGSADVARNGLDYEVRASRAGTVTATLVPAGASGARVAAGVHARDSRRLVAGGMRHRFQLALNRRGRAAVRRAGPMRYELRVVFRDQDGVRVTRKRTVVVVDA
jgi:hypothetical protein